MRKDPGGDESWREDKNPLVNAFWTAYTTESSSAPLSSELSPIDLIALYQASPLGARPMPPSRVAPKTGLPERQTLHDNTNTRSDSGSGSGSSSSALLSTSSTDSAGANERPAVLPKIQNSFMPARSDSSSGSSTLRSTPSTESERADERPEVLPKIERSFMPTSVSAKERQAVLPKIEISFLSTSARANERPAVAPQVQNSFVRASARSDERPANKPRIESYPLGIGFATLSKPRPPSPRALPSTPVIPFVSKASALSTTAARPTASNMNRKASYNAALGSLVDAPNATARVERVLGAAGGSGRNKRVPAPGFGLLRRQNQARAGVLQVVLPLDHDEEEWRAHAQEDGRAEPEEDGAGDGAHGNTVAAPVRSRPGVRRRHPLHGEEDGRDAESAGNGTAPAPAPGPGPAAAAAAPPSTATGDSAPPDVLLEEFCRYYGVNATDKARLSRLEFEPGDEIDSLPEDDWKGFAGFTTLAWRRIIAKNQAFISDSQGGLLV